jgi:hypothetical protein
MNYNPRHGIVFWEDGRSVTTTSSDYGIVLSGDGIEWMA